MPSAVPSSEAASSISSPEPTGKSMVSLLATVAASRFQFCCTEAIMYETKRWGFSVSAFREASTAYSMHMDSASGSAKRIPRRIPQVMA